MAIIMHLNPFLTLLSKKLRYLHSIFIYRYFLFLSDLQKHQAKGTAADSFSRGVTHCDVSNLYSLIKATINYMLRQTLLGYM